MKPWLPLFLKLLFAAGSIALLLQFAPVSKILAVLGTVSIPWLIVGIAAQFTVRFAATFRMQVVTRIQGLSLSLSQLYRILLASQFYSIFLPGVLGGGAAWVKYIQHGAGQAAAAVVVLLNRGIYIVTTIALGFCAWVVDQLPRGPVATTILLMPVAACVVLALAWPPLGSAPRSAAQTPTSRIRHFAGRFLRLLELSRTEKLIVVTSTCLEILIAAAASWFLATAVGIEIAFLSAVWVHAAMAVVLLLPVTVAGLGLREAGLVGFGAILGVEAPQAMAWSLTILFGTLLVAATGGLFEARSTSREIGNLLDGQNPGRDERDAP